MQEAIIIFVRKPELGKVKTRLAATVGDKRALKIYIELLAHTNKVTQNIEADKFVFYNNEICAKDIWDKKVYQKKLQAKGDLGNKMKEAFAYLFKKGYKKVLIIGSDCFQLEETIIREALVLLEQKDVVIGPANDGGYYLLGMKKLHEEIFENKSWSTASVLKDTLANFEMLNLKWIMLPALIDVDTEEDLIASKSYSNEGNYKLTNPRSV